MFDFLKPESASSTAQQVAHSLRWLGWVGFWLQALLGFIPILVVISTVFSRAAQPMTALSLGVWLALACLIILVFSIYWCFRYTRLASRLESRDLRPARAQVMRDLKLGLVANIGMMAIAVLIALSRVGSLTFKMLTLPQGATVITPNQLGTTLGAPGALITPSNMIAIHAMISAIAAGLVGTIVSLLLLYQVGQSRNSPD
jgi:heme/copper-type cytochrome/quinol oxidase subunit 4